MQVLDANGLRAVSLVWPGKCPMGSDLPGLSLSPPLTTCVTLHKKISLCLSFLIEQMEVTAHRWLGGLDFKFKYDARKAAMSMGKLYHENP